jgi:hypothetical protein
MPCSLTRDRPLTFLGTPQAPRPSVMSRRITTKVFADICSVVGRGRTAFVAFREALAPLTRSLPDRPSKRGEQLPLS